MLRDYLKQFSGIRWFYRAWTQFNCWVIHRLPHYCLIRWRYYWLWNKLHRKRSPLLVLFVVCNPAKWKMQTLYDLLSRSEHFKPLICLTILDQEQSLPLGEKMVHLTKAKCFFAQRHMQCVTAYDIEHAHHLPFKVFNPDIVWYQDPWFLDCCQMPDEVSKYALTCYVPYFVQNYGALNMDCELDFHRYLWRHFTLNARWADAFNKDLGIFCSGKVLGMGHPMLDQFHDPVKRGSPCTSHRDYIIYAPHWSCGVGERYSTFMKMGKSMLALALQHPELKWVFKPHPTLRVILSKLNLMSKQEIDAYYRAWEDIAVVCYDGNYIDLFKRSRVLITDCGSFLVEYACTGQPIIHLISEDPKFPPHPVSAALFKTYYQAFSWETFIQHFNMVVLNHNDPLRELRLAKIKEMNLLGTNAAQNILNVLSKTLCR